MTDNQTAARESTLLSVITQALARGASVEDLAPYIEQLTLESSKQLIRDVVTSLRAPQEPVTRVGRWARSFRSA
jgi:hypothetical protein